MRKTEIILQYLQPMEEPWVIMACTKGEKQMCGIIGYTGNEPAKDILINGLKQLEYRGYDSAGIAVLDPKTGIVLKKKTGKVEELA